MLGLLAGRNTEAAGIELIPDGLWWRREAPTSLGVAPLEVLAAPRLRAESEWWPLYSDRHGAHLEGARRSMTAALPIVGPANSRWGISAGAEILESFVVARGGSGSRGFGIEEARERRASLGVATHAGRFRTAMSMSFGEGSMAGLAVGAEVEPAPGWHASGSWSRTSGGGIGSARWDEVAIEASSAWREQMMDVRASGVLGAVRARVGLSSLDRSGLEEPRHDGVDPELAWRAVRVAAGMPAARVRWEIEAFQGGGRQRLSVSREGATYGSASGPIEASGVTVRAGLRNSRLELRASAGQWNAEASGYLATWPFEALTAVTGTRLVASSRAMLEHHGLQLDRLPAARGWDGGLALWHVSPRADYRSWRATLYGIGRDDYREDSGLIPEVWMLGVRAALVVAPAGVPMRLECVQWIPFAVARHSEPAEGGAPTDPPPSTPSDSAPTATGGTILRLRLGS